TPLPSWSHTAHPVPFGVTFWTNAAPLFPGGQPWPPSVNVAVAVNPDKPPVAVRVNVIPASWAETMKSVLRIFPELSATVDNTCGPSLFGFSTNVSVTVSPAAQPDPVTVTVDPGA